MIRWELLRTWLLLAGLLSGYACAALAQAQPGEYAREQQIYEWLVAGRGDSIHAALNRDLQQKLSPLVFNDTFQKSEHMFGKLQSKGEWRTETAQGISFSYSDLRFERYTLRLLIAFDADGGMNTLRLMPAPAASTAQEVTYDANRMQEREVTVGADGFRLPGTLTLPGTAVGSSVRRVPCVILVHGSGPNDRDETVGPNKPFRDLAWGLAERGIATIRYDKRTKVYGGQFVPEGRQADYDTEAVDDALSAVAQALTLPEVASDSIFILGHSLGGTLAPRIAERSDALAGIVLLAALARPLEDALLEQSTYLASLTDAATPDAARQLELLQQQVANVKKLGTEAFDETLSLPLALPRSYWQLANAYKPVRVAARLKLPLLVLQGERDYQVTMEDFGLWRYGLLRCRNARFKSYPALNHLLQEGSGKSTPFEYSQASPVPAYVMDDVARFIRGGVDF